MPAIKIVTHDKFYRDMWFSDQDLSGEDYDEVEKIGNDSQKRTIEKLMYGDFQLHVNDDGSVTVTIDE